MSTFLSCSLQCGFKGLPLALWCAGFQERVLTSPLNVGMEKTVMTSGLVFSFSQNILTILTPSFLGHRSFFRSDKHVGTAHLKLDKLESECEVREIIEVRFWDEVCSA